MSIGGCIGNRPFNLYRGYMCCVFFLEKNNSVSKFDWKKIRIKDMYHTYNATATSNTIDAALKYVAGIINFLTTTRNRSFVVHVVIKSNKTTTLTLRCRINTWYFIQAFR